MQYKCDFCHDTGSMTTDYDLYDCVDCNVVEHRLALDAWLEDQYKNGLMRRIHGLDAWNIYRAALAMAPKQEAPTAYMHTLAEGVFGDSGRNSQFLHTEEEAKDELSRHGGTVTKLCAAPAAANGALTDADILTIIWKYSSFISAGNYSRTQFDCQADTLNCVRAILAAAGPDAELIEDAMRYRFLRKLQKPACFWPVIMITQEWLCTPEEVDAAIDATLSGAKGN